MYFLPWNHGLRGAEKGQLLCRGLLPCARKWKFLRRPNAFHNCSEHTTNGPLSTHNRRAHKTCDAHGEVRGDTRCGRNRLLFPHAGQVLFLLVRSISGETFVQRRREPYVCRTFRTTRQRAVECPSKERSSSAGQSECSRHAGVACAQSSPLRDKHWRRVDVDGRRSERIRRVRNWIQKRVKESDPCAILRVALNSASLFVKKAALAQRSLFTHSSPLGSRFGENGSGRVKFREPHGDSPKSCDIHELFTRFKTACCSTFHTLSTKALAIRICHIETVPQWFKTTIPINSFNVQETL